MQCNKNIFIILITLFIFIPIIGLAKETSDLNETKFLDSYYQHLFVGERTIGNYQGPEDSRTFFNEEKGVSFFLDEQYFYHFFDKQIQPEVFNLHSFWLNKVVDKSTCPDIALGENVDYIRYLYRLLTISYLFESLKINHKISSALGFEKNECSPTFENIFNKCRPTTDDMRKFKERIYGKFSNELSKYRADKFNKKETIEWYLDFKKSTSLSIDPAQAGLHNWCHQEGRNCRDLSSKNIKQALGEICNRDRSLIQSLCSEEDNLFGASYLENATELLQSSNAFNLINLHGMGEDCLSRYVKIFSPKEFRYDFLINQFPLIYSYLRRNKNHSQGELFLPGALKEFDMKGLSDFLSALRPPKIKISIPVLPPKKTPVKLIAIENPQIPAPEIDQLKPEVVKLEIREPPVLKISEFEKTLSEFNDKKIQSLSLNMDKFKDDFEFSLQMIVDISVPISKFQTRAALNDMKTYDNLGSINAPVGLIFLKYLIDTENHQGLFNITTVLGEKFYVVNDIEKKEKAVYIQLLNDSSTNNKWQITLIKAL